MDKRKTLDFIYCKTQKIIQTIYILFAIIGTFGIVGNIEIDCKTPTRLLVIWFISLFLTISKLQRLNKSGKH